MANYTRPLLEYLELQLEQEQRRRALGEQIRYARKGMGVRQQAMAAAIGVSNAYLSQIESGTRTPSQETMISIVNYFQKGEAHGSDQDEAQAQEDH